MTAEEDWVVVEVVAGSLQAEFLRSLLESQDISVVLSQESAGSLFPVTVGLLGEVQILVSPNDVSRAKKILDDYYAGNPDDQTQTEEQESMVDESDEPQ